MVKTETYIKKTSFFKNETKWLNMCVGATKGTFRRDIKMIVNHDYMKQCIIFVNKFLADYTSKYCLLFIQLTSASFIHLNTPISDVLCVHVASSVFFAKPYTIRGKLLNLSNFICISYKYFVILINVIYLSRALLFLL